MQTKTGAMRCAARRLGISLDEYQGRLGLGQKWCGECRGWKPKTSFGIDARRGDGLAARCLDCRRSGDPSKPSRQERESKRLVGLFWCRGCEAWVAVGNQARKGICREHAAKDARDRYKSDPIHRAKRIQHVRSRQRNIKPIPPEGMDAVTEEFGGRCAYCGNVADTWDHVHPVVNGGDSVPENVVPACRACNSSKGDEDVAEWIDKTGRPINEKVIDRMSLAFCRWPG